MATDWLGHPLNRQLASGIPFSDAQRSALAAQAGLQLFRSVALPIDESLGDRYSGDVFLKPGQRNPFQRTRQVPVSDADLWSGYVRWGQDLESGPDGLLGALGAVAEIIRDVAAFTSLAPIEELDPIREVFPTVLMPEVHEAAIKVGAAQLWSGAGDAALERLATKELLVRSEFVDRPTATLIAGATPMWDELSNWVSDASSDIDWGALAQSGINAYAQMNAPAPIIRDYGMQSGVPMAAPGMTQAAFPMIAGAARMLPSWLGGAAAAGAVARVAGTIVRSASGAIRGVFSAGGRLIRNKQAAQLARRVGIEAAAVALGIGAVDLAQMVLEDAVAKKKKHGGVTASQLKVTRRTIGKVERMHKFIVASCHSAHVPTHRRSLPAKRCR